MSATENDESVDESVDETEGAKRKRGPIKEERVSKREFVTRVARRSRVSPETTLRVYEAMLEEVLELIADGHDVVWTGFGKFYLTAHKGHLARNPVEGTVNGRLDDYPVLKFSATREASSVAGGKIDLKKLKEIKAEKAAQASARRKRGDAEESQAS